MTVSRHWELASLRVRARKMVEACDELTYIGLNVGPRSIRVALTASGQRTTQG